MTDIRRGLLFSSADRYFVMLVNFATLLVTSRLLTPADFGISVVGLAALGIADIIRDFGGTAYIVQVDRPTPERIQTVFTITFVLTLPLALFFFCTAGWIAEFYGEPGLMNYFHVASACFMIGPFGAPMYALMRRDLAFGRIAFINAVSSSTNGIVTIVLSFLGFRYMSFAWAALAAALSYVAMCLVWGPKFPIYRISLTEWRQVAAYGVYDSARNMLFYLWSAVPSLAFGKTLGTDGLGLYNRASTVSRLPATTLLAGMAPVLLPAFSKRARDGHDLKTSYLSGIEHVTVILWPCLMLVIVLAHPLVLILLGSQWLSSVPVVQVLAFAFLFWFSLNLTNPTLIAAGAVRDTLGLALVTVPPSIAIEVYSSTYGIMTTAISTVFTGIFFVTCSVIAVRRRIPFAWTELVAVLRRSAVVALFSAVGPAILVLSMGGPNNISIIGAVAGTMLSGLGWLAGLAVTRHPMKDELELGLNALGRVARDLQPHISSLFRIQSP